MKCFLAVVLCVLLVECYGAPQFDSGPSVDSVRYFKPSNKHETEHKEHKDHKEHKTPVKPDHPEHEGPGQITAFHQQFSPEESKFK